MTKNQTIANALASESDNESFVDIMEFEALPPIPATENKEEALKLSVTPRHDIVGRDAIVHTTQVCATIKAGDLPDDDKRAPVDIVVALDLSSSMRGDKLALCKTTLELLLRQLLPQDRFSLVTFADDATVEIPTMNLTDGNKQSAMTKIKALQVRGCTNISAAIGMAAQELGAIENPNKVRSIFLLTDGHANRGISDTAGIVSVAKGCLVDTKDDSTPPITIHCFGYGTHHNSELLTDVSETTVGGTYYFVENDSNVAAAFGDALGGILSVMAQNVVVNLRVSPESSHLGVEITKAHHENVLKREDGSWAVTIGDFYAEESRDVLFDIKLATPMDGSCVPIPHVDVSLSYTDTLNKALVTEEPKITCSIARPPGTEVSHPDSHVMAQWLRIHCTNEMDEADKMSGRGDLVSARARIQQCKELVTAQDSLQSDPLVRQLAVDLDKVLGGLSSSSVYESHGEKAFKRARQTHRMQRCNEGSLDTYNVYRGMKGYKMAKRFDSNK